MKDLSRKDFYRQLGEFANDRSYFSLYDNVELKSDKYLIRLFRYSIEKKKKSSILIPTEDGGVTTNFEATGKIITNIGIIIKIGDKPVHDGDYNIGDIVVCQKSDIIGELPNPEWVNILQFSRMGGDVEPIKPQWLKERLPSLQVKWYEYQFSLPHEFDTPTQNVLTFAIPYHKISYKWEL